MRACESQVAAFDIRIGLLEMACQFLHFYHVTVIDCGNHQFGLRMRHASCQAKR
jgi:hypothetical protein